MEEVCERLGLENVTCVHARAEDGAETRITERNLTVCIPCSGKFVIFIRVLYAVCKGRGIFYPL